MFLEKLVSFVSGGYFLFISVCDVLASNSDTPRTGAVSHHGSVTLLLRERKLIYVTTCALSVRTCEFACSRPGESNLAFTGC